MSPEYRVCPISGRSVIIAPQRAARPVTLPHFAPHHRETINHEPCPFCPGNESETPATIFQMGEPWQLRVVANKFPAARQGHEVLIECREHFADPTELSDAQLAAVFGVYRQRMIALQSDPSVRFVSVFKNVGAEAGASLPHLHSQILAMPFVPEVLRTELAVTRSNAAAFETMLAAKDLRVAQSEHFAAVCPDAPRFAYETWLMPLRPCSRYEMITDSECADLAWLMRRVLRGLDEVLESAAYNWLIHTAPEGEPWYRWHLELLPRTDRAAGFEWATGVFINTTPPELAASHLQAAMARVECHQ